MSKVLTMAVVVAVAILGYVFVVQPLVLSCEVDSFYREVKDYNKQVEQEATKRTFTWANTQGHFYGNEYQRLELIDRLGNLRQGLPKNAGEFYEDTWLRLHQDILSEVAWSARRKAEADMGIDRNNISGELLKRYLPQDFQQYYDLMVAHQNIRYGASGCHARDYTPEKLAKQREEFARDKAKMNELRAQLARK